MSRPLPLACLALLIVAGAVAVQAQPIVADHEAADQFDSIPVGYFDTIRDQFRFFYGHTSHGSQIPTGIALLENEDGDLYADVAMHEISDDLGHNGDTSWVAPTRSYLDDHPDCNVVMWSWCGGCSDNTVEGIEIYLAAMAQLEAEYPDVVFVYMTGHLDGSGPEGNLYQRNNQIRDYCLANDKVLFDFADIESYDPDETWYPDDDDSCNWCLDWCGDHPCPDCSNCAHSRCFNCYRKGRAFWWMMARVAGWQQATVAAPSVLPGRPALAPNWPNPFNPSTTIAFSLPGAMAARLTIHDSRGRFVVELADGAFAAGRHEVTWQGRDRSGRSLPSGHYFCRLETDLGVETRSLTLLK